MKMDTNLVLPSFYLPPINAVSAIHANRGNLIIEKFEHFPKQTYRNRAVIYSPNGKLDLIIPVVKGSKVHTVIKDVRISYESNWQRLHWLSLQTSYRRSAYFEFYEDNFAPFYSKKYDFLFDFNLELLQQLLQLLKIKKEVILTDSYKKEYIGATDLRASIHPKKTFEKPEIKTYFQVFEPKHGFFPNLSIIDLLFNQGPNSLNYL
jgi:hypothetical protein